MNAPARETVTVFGYGALMAECSKCSGQAALLTNYELEFTLRGAPPLEPSFIALAPRHGACAHGVLIEYEASRWARRRRAERGYDVVEVEVELPDGTRTEAMTLIPSGARLVHPRPPSARYARLLRIGAERHGLPEHVIERYRELERSGPKLSLLLRWLKAPVILLVPSLGLRMAICVVLCTLVVTLSLLVKLAMSS